MKKLILLKSDIKFYFQPDHPRCLTTGQESHILSLCESHPLCNITTVNIEFKLRTHKSARLFLTLLVYLCTAQEIFVQTINTWGF